MEDPKILIAVKDDFTRDYLPKALGDYEFVKVTGTVDIIKRAIEEGAIKGIILDADTFADDGLATYLTDKKLATVVFGEKIILPKGLEAMFTEADPDFNGIDEFLSKNIK